MRRAALVVLLLLAGCGGEASDPRVLLDVTIVDSGERFQTAYRLADGELTRLTGGIGRRTAFGRAASRTARASSGRRSTSASRTDRSAG